MTFDGGHMVPPPRRSPRPWDDLPPMSPRAMAVIDCARDLAWMTHGNTSKSVYVARKEAYARLRGALEEYDHERKDEG